MSWGGVSLQFAIDRLSKSYALQQKLEHDRAFMKREHDPFPDEYIHVTPGDILIFNYTRLDYGMGACRLVIDDASTEKNIAMVQSKGVIIPSMIHTFYQDTQAIYNDFHFNCSSLYRFNDR